MNNDMVPSTSSESRKTVSSDEERDHGAIVDVGMHVNVAECHEDREKLSMVLLQLAAARMNDANNQYAMHDLDSDACLRTRRLIGNLEAYMKRVALEEYALAHAEERTGFEANIVHSCLVEILPEILDRMMSNDSEMLVHVPTILCAWTKLYAAFLLARILEYDMFKGGISKHTHEELEACSTVMCMAFDKGYVNEFLYGDEQGGGRDMAHIVGCCEHTDRLTDWVQVDYLRHVSEDEGRYLRAVLLDTFASARGMENLLLGLKLAPHLPIDTIDSLLCILHACMYLISESKRSVIGAYMDYICEHFEAGFRLEGFEGFQAIGGGHPSSHMCSVLRMMYNVAGITDKERNPLKSRISSYQKETVLRLFNSENVSLQLSAVKALDRIVSQASSNHTASLGNHKPYSLPKHLEWIESTDIVSSMLRANLHHSQYIEDMQDLLRRLALYGAVRDDHIQYLWSIVDDEGTFDEMKCNVAQLLGSLASSMPEDNADALLCQKLAETHLSSSSIKYVGDLLTTASKHDAHGVLIYRLMEISLDFALDDSVEENLGSVGLFLDVCQAYEEVEGVEKVIAEAIRLCMSKMSAKSIQTTTRPLQVMLHVFQGHHVSRELVSQVYKVLNPNAAFSKSLLRLYGDTLRENEIVSGREIEVLRIFNRLLKLVLNDSDYYVNIEIMKTILGWTDARRYSQDINDLSWNLLVSLVLGDKGVQCETLHEFLLIALQTVQAADLTLVAWRCITAFLAATFNYNSRMYDGESSYAFLLEISRDNSSIALWDIVIPFLLDCVVSSSNETVTREASKTLSSLLSEKVNIDRDEKSVNQVMESIGRCKALLEESYQVMFDAAIDEQIPWEPVSVTTFDGMNRLNKILHLLKYFEDLIRAFASAELVENRPLDASYKGDGICICVNFQELPVSPRVSEHRKFVEIISCPRNALIGDFRGCVSRKASNFVGYFIPQENFRLFQGGREMCDNAASLSCCISGDSSVMAVFTPMAHATMAKQCSESGLRLTQSLAQDCKLFKILINFSNLDSSSKEDFGVGESQKVPKRFEDIATLAMDLLLKLPVCDTVMNYILSDMNNADMNRFKSLICMDQGQSMVNSSAMLYSCIVLYSHINPMVGDERKSSEFIKHPIDFLETMRLVYEKSSDLNRRRMAGVFIHLVQHISLESESSIDLINCLLLTTLIIISDFTSKLEVYSTEDVFFISSSGLEVILRLCSDRELGESMVIQLSQIIQGLFKVDSELVRNLAVQHALSLSIKHGLGSRLFQDVAKGIILAKNPSKEEIAFCMQLLEQENGDLNDQLGPLVTELCECIGESLSKHESIAGYSKSLHFVLQHVEIGLPTTMKQLISKIISEYLFPEIKLYPAEECCGIEDQERYIQVLKNGSYSLREQDNLYRVLLSCALVFDDCWRNLNEELLDAFRKSEKGFPRLYNNMVQSNARDLAHYCGLFNGGATCYMNATFQQLFMQPNLRKNLLLCSAAGTDKSCPVLEALSVIFLHLSGSIAPAVDPSVFWKVFKDYDGNPVDVQEHQDAYEFFTRLQDTIDEFLKDTGCVRAIYSVLGGSFNQIIEVPGHDGLRSEREEEFYQISLDVRGKENLAQSLESYVAVETLDGQNQWFCEELGRKVDAKKRTLLKRLPESLVFHFKRFEWDFETLSRWKIKDRFEFPLALDMQPYVDAAHAEGGENYMYELSGIIIHSGTAFAGHYYSYAKERNSGKWFCFDDDTVIPWDVSNIDRDCFGGLFMPEGSDRRYQRNHSAYIVMYDRVQFTAMDKVGFLDMFHLIPQEKRAQMVLNNFLELNRMHVFHPTLPNFMLLLAREMSIALDGPRALKSKRIDNSAGPSLQIRNEIFYQHDRRENKASEGTIRQVVSLCLNYICQVYIFSPFDKSSDNLDPISEMREPLTRACSLPSVAERALSFFSLPPGGHLSRGLSALESPYRSARILMREILLASVRCLSEDDSSMQDSSNTIGQVIESIINHVGSALADYPSATVKWKDMMGALHDMRSIKLVESILLENLVRLTALSESIFQLWRQLTRSQREDQDFAAPYLGLVLPLLRMHRLPCMSVQDKDLQHSNPFILRLSSEQLHIDELPPGIFPGNSACSETIRFYLLSGQVQSMESILFMKWFAWENRSRSNILVVSILFHIQDSSSVSELASEASAIVDVLAMEDSNAASRISNFIFGFALEDASLPGELGSQTRTEVPGLMDSCLLCRNAAKTYLMSVILLGVLQKNPELYISLDSHREKFSDWATGSLVACNQISERLSADQEFRTIWLSMIPSTEDSMCNLFDPNQLSDQLSTVAQSMDPSIPHKRRRNIAGIDNVVCIKANHDESGGNTTDDDAVAEIDIEENP